MKFRIIYLLFSLLLLSSCKKNATPISLINCTEIPFVSDLAYHDLLKGIPDRVIIALAEEPNELGALGRNKNGYFHVRFQFSMQNLSDYTLKFQSTEGLSTYVNSLKYSFSHQNIAGDFQFIAPDDLLNSANYQAPSDSELASATAFFGYSLGLGLHSLSTSDWYQNTNTLSPMREEIQTLDPNINRMLGYLKRSKDLLNTVDANAPNRLLFNAIAFYSLGNYLNDEEAKSIGIEFANTALAQHDATEGYFIEGGGWDSSYNGVAIKLGFELFSLIPRSENQSTKNTLEQVINCATNWQKSRIQTTGEISTEGNSRVYPGGEDFLGNEKAVDFTKTAIAFFYMNTLTDNNEYVDLAEKVIAYYD